MICAVCLDVETGRPLGEDGRQPLEAITIANGHAVCPGHFAVVRDLMNNAGGPVALWGVRPAYRARFGFA